MKRYRIDVFADGKSMPETDTYWLDAPDLSILTESAMKLAKTFGHSFEDIVITEEESDLDRIYF